MLAVEIKERIKEGYDTFVSGMDWGTDIFFAEIVLDLRRVYPHIKLITVIPYEEQANCWNEDYRNRYFGILEQADKTHIVSRQYTKKCTAIRRRWIVEHVNDLLVVWNGLIDNTKLILAYAQRKGLKIKTINLSNI